MPAVSVLLPVRNAHPYLARALGSLWRQSFRDFEVVAVDDGSTDGSGELLERATEHHTQLTVVRTEARGLPSALNTALRKARAPWVARMDADDLVHPRRLEVQRAHLAAHRDVAVVGSRVRLFPASAVGVGMRRWAEWHNGLLAHEEMAREVLIDSPLVHGTAMIRREWLDRLGGWTERPWPEDLDLWIRMIEAGARLSKRPEILYAWRQHPHSATRSDPRYRLVQFQALKLDTLARRLLDRAPPPTAIGVGASLTRWHELLRSRYPNARRVVARQPTRALIESLEPPLILVLVAYQRRDVWRRELVRWGMIEGKSFVFVA